MQNIILLIHIAITMLALAFFFTISIINTVPVHFNTTPNGFPKVIWSYWEQGIESASFFTKLCIKNRDEIAEASGWKHIILSNSSLNEYIDPEEVQTFMAIATTRFIQLKADLIRLLLILKYGGLWLDINSYFLRDLSWVSNPEQMFISNQFGQSPDLILAAYTKGSIKGNQTFRTHKSGQDINISPIYENWMILGKPDNQFLTDCLKIYVETHQKTKQRMDQQNLKKGIKLPEQILNYYFIGSDYIQQIAIQRKQFELQQQKSPLFAVEYYKIWHLEADQSAFKIFLDYNQYIMPMWADLSIYSTQQIEQNGQIPFFRKYIGWQHPFFSNILNNYATYNCWGLQFFIEKDSEISDSLIEFGHNEPFMQNYDEIIKNIDSKDYCITSQAKRQTQILSIFLWSWYLLYLFMIFFTVWCCYRRTSKNKNIEWRPTEAQ